MIKLLDYSRVALFTTLNVVLNALTLGDYVWLEGRAERRSRRERGMGVHQGR